ncbi:hypothetical protein PV327_004675 [Microctonus hyperodae]|uniref:phospholipase A1 n=1 Tax=Microctonus hyperodae TaxID=165561 RepID=A0AA39FCY5_MICHY|nr:hypothetical protein PV327_004675 [Microctonus hyperodae]
MSLYIKAVLIFLSINLKTTNTRAQIVPTELTYKDKDINTNHDIQFFLYTRKNPSKPYLLEYKNNKSLEVSPINPETKTVIFIHGFAETAFDVTPQALLDAYLKQHKYNVILVDWRNHAAAPWYNRAAENVEMVGSHVAKFVKWLKHKNIISNSNLHVIGYSLGAHVAGFMGKELYPKIERITGLDPAGPLFRDVHSTKRLDKSDALFVDVIHTSSKSCGIQKPIGHADFYPNHGITQPGCKFYDFACSHNRARFYYIESIHTPRGFPAKKCREWTPYIRDCTLFPETYMGISVDHHTYGIFYLRTQAEAPYARHSKDCRYIYYKETEF